LTTSAGRGPAGFLDGVRVLEVADELGEYCGRVLAGVGADVVKIEPPTGEVTRSYGPFAGDRPDPEGSLYFWHYNFGKRGVTLDLDDAGGQAEFLRLAAGADVVIDTRPASYLDDRSIGYDALRALNPGLVMARISPFGDRGPWRGYKGSDLVHLALGGVMMNCGYDPDPTGFYETPPIAPQMWQAYQITGELAAIAIMGALFRQAVTGQGQFLSTSVHGCVAQQTELDLPNWIYVRRHQYRRTCRHSRPNPDPAGIAATKDGRWLFPYRSYLGAGGSSELERTAAILDRYGMAADLGDGKYQDPAYRARLDVREHIGDVVNRFISRWTFDREIWRDFQADGLTWAPLRRPEENVADDHWRSRETFTEVYRPELGRSYVEVGAKWLCQEVPWRNGPRSPLLGEHNAELLGTRPSTPDRVRPVVRADLSTSARPAGLGKASALDGVRFIDLGWLLASAGAGRFLAAMGAEVIKVEHKSRWDGMRWVNAIAPDGGRAARAAAPGPMPILDPASPNRGGYFLEINAGKRAVSLNLKHPRGREIFRDLVAGANIVGEGFSAGTMDRMGLGYEELKKINPSIIYVQQSGTGQHGTYGPLRSYGPVAQGFSGLSEMSGLPEPFPPAGIGYSYLDWFGAYNMATAMLAALYRQERTGQGCWIDSSQVEAGIYLNGTAILDHSVNGRPWSRYGNRSPYKPAAPHGAYRTAGTDRWIAIGCFTEAEWTHLLQVLAQPAWGAEPRFATQAARLARQDELDELISRETEKRDGFALMHELQRAGVPAGVCQNAQDRVDHDPQLAALGWMAELRQSEIGVWPCREFPVDFSETPAYMGGIVDRHGPNYAEDNDYVYGEVLGYSPAQISELADNDVI
jgi:crotonobetainyl-CoA:carnitine CoA-transferase CaiB-like acyl-CoA transferase